MNVHVYFIVDDLHDTWSGSKKPAVNQAKADIVKLSCKIENLTRALLSHFHINSGGGGGGSYTHSLSRDGTLSTSGKTDGPFYGLFNITSTLFLGNFSQLTPYLEKLTLW